MIVRTLRATTTILLHQDLITEQSGLIGLTTIQRNICTMRLIPIMMSAIITTTQPVWEQPAPSTTITTQHMIIEARYQAVATMAVEHTNTHQHSREEAVLARWRIAGT